LPSFLPSSDRWSHTFGVAVGSISNVPASADLDTSPLTATALPPAVVISLTAASAPGRSVA